MIVNDSTNLLKECNAGTKMAYNSIDEVLGKVKSEKLRDVLKESKSHHEKLCDRIHGLLNEYGCEEKEVSPIAGAMSWIKINAKTAMDDSDRTIADLMTDGCDMGIKSLYKYKHQYKNADQTVVDICDRLIDIEGKLEKELREYL